jgi:hypothetical protein
MIIWQECLYAPDPGKRESYTKVNKAVEDMLHTAIRRECSRNDVVF